MQRRFGCVVLGACLMAVSGCGRAFAPSPFFQSDLAAAFKPLCEAKGEVTGPVEDGQWADEKTPNYRNRTIVLNLRVTADQVQPLYNELRTEVLKLAAQGGATISNPKANVAASMSARDSNLYRYRTAGQNHGLLTLNLRAGHTTLQRDPTFKGGMATEAAGEDGFSIELTLAESPGQ